VRTIERPDTCAWTAPRAPMLYDPFNYPNHVFGNGQWVNTGAGVRYLTTGEHAPFGADAGGVYPHVVFYSGDASERIFRVVTSDPDDDPTFQPWDTTTNRAVSGAVTARYILAPDLPIYVAVDSSGPEADMGLATARQWATGDPTWQTPTYSTPAWPALFVGDVYVQQLPTPDGDIAEALDPATGEQIWHYGEANVPLIGAVRTVLYLGRSPAVGYEFADAPKPTIAFDSPTNDCLMQVAGGHVIAYSFSSGEVYVLIV